MPTGTDSATGLRASAVRLRKEGERLAARIDRDVRALTKRTRAEIASDVRKLQSTMRSRADDAIRDLEKRGASVVGGVEKQVAKMVEDLLKRFHGATQRDVSKVVKRVQELEARVAALEGESPDENTSI